MALLAISWPGSLVRKVGTCKPPRVFSVAEARPLLASISPRLRQSVLELWHAGPTYLQGGDGLRWGDVLAKAYFFATLSPADWQDLFSDLEDMLVFTPVDLKSAPLSELHLVTGPGIRGEMLRELRNAANAFSQGSNQSIGFRPFPRTRRPQH